MFFDFSKLPGQETYKLLCATITPRPIAWIVSADAHGVLNCAPFSFFNVLSGDPPVIAVGIGAREANTPKDTAANVLATHEFVVNLVSYEMARPMNITATDFPTGVNELEKAGLQTAPSTVVAPPRIAASPVALECRLRQRIELGPAKSILLADVLAMHVRDDRVLDATRHHIDTPNLDLVGRMHGAGWYARTTDLFNVDRIAYKDWEES